MNVDLRPYPLSCEGVYTRLWQAPEHFGEVFHVPLCAITDTDQQTEEQKWTLKKERENNYGNLDPWLVAMWEKIIEEKIHTGRIPWGEGGRSPHGPRDTGASVG